MAYTETWTGSNGASWPAAWTTNSTGAGTIDIQSNRGRMLTATTPNFNVCQATLSDSDWDEIDGEVYVEFTVPSGSLPQLNVPLRSDGAWGLGDIPSTAYIAQANMAGNNFFILKAVAGSVTQLGSTESLSYSTGATYALRFRCEGSTISLKVWDTAGSEPGSWAISETDTGITGAGQTGLSCRTLTGGVARQVAWDNFSVQGLAVDADAPATTVELAVGVPTPTVTASATPTPSPVVATVAIPTPTVTASATPTPSTVTMTVDVPLPVTSRDGLQKGVGAPPDAGIYAEDIDALNVSWWHNWWYHPIPDTPGAEFVPMMWGDWEAMSTETPAQVIAATGATTLMGFNEPDYAVQSNITVERALTLWDDMDATGVRLGSPAVSAGSGGPEWLEDFMAASPRVDFICAHWYPDFSPDPLDVFLDNLYAKYGLPIWLTEVGSLTGGVAANEALIPDVIDILRTRPFVERVAWFATRDGDGWTGSGLLTKADVPLWPGTGFWPAVWSEYANSSGSFSVSNHGLGVQTTGAVGSYSDWSIQILDDIVPADETINVSLHVGDAVEKYPAIQFRSNANTSDCYELQIRVQQSEILFRRRASNSYTTLATLTPTFSDDDILHFEIVCDGTDIDVYVWVDGDSKPGSPSASDTSGTFSTQTRFLLSNVGGNAATSTTVAWSDLVFASLDAGGVLNDAGVAYAALPDVMPYHENPAPGPVTLPIVIPAATIASGSNPTPSTVDLAVVIPQPAITASATPTPAAVTLAVSVPAPTGSIPATATATTVTLSVSVPSPTVTATATPTPSPVVASVVIPAPSAGTGTFAAPGPVELTVVIPAMDGEVLLDSEGNPILDGEGNPIFIGGGTVVVTETATPSTVGLAVEIPAPTPSTAADGTATPSPVVATVDIPTPTGSIPATATATTVTATVSIPAPTVTATGAPSATTVTLAVAVPSPTVNTESPGPTPEVVELALEVPSPTVTVTGTAAVTTVDLTVTVPSPTAFIGTLLSPDPVTLATVIPSPSIGADQVFSVTTVELVVSVPRPASGASLGYAVVEIQAESVRVALHSSEAAAQGVPLDWASRFSVRRSVYSLMKINGSYVEVPPGHVTASLLNQATEVYLGGSRYEVTQEVGNALVDAGYSDHVTFISG